MTKTGLFGNKCRIIPIIYVARPILGCCRGYVSCYATMNYLFGRIGICTAVNYYGLKNNSRKRGKGQVLWQ